MARRIDINVSAAISQTGRPVKADIAVPRDEDLSIIVTGAPVGAVLRFAVATTPGGEPIYTCRGTGNVITVEARDIGRTEAVKESQPYHFSISIADPSDEKANAAPASLFLANGSFLQTPTINPDGASFDEALISDAYLPVIRLSQTQFDALPVKEFGRPYFIVNPDAVSGYLTDGSFRVVAVYVGPFQKYPDFDTRTPPVLPRTLPDLDLPRNSAPVVIDVAALSTGVTGAEWSVSGVEATITQAGVVTILSTVARPSSFVTITAVRDGLPASAGFAVTVQALQAPPEITPGRLPDVSPITRVIEGTTLSQIAAQVTDKGSATITGGGQFTITLEVISDTSNDPTLADDRIIGVRQVFTAPGAEPAFGEIVPLNIAVEAAAIEVTVQPTTVGLSNLNSAMTLQQIEDGWTGRPVGVANNGSPVTYQYTFFADGSALTNKSALAPAGPLTIHVNMVAQNMDATMELPAPLIVGPVTVASAGGQASITGTGPQLLNPVIAGTPPGYQRLQVTRTAYTSSNGNPVTIQSTLIRVNGTVVQSADLFNESFLIQTGDTVVAEDVVAADGALSRTIQGSTRTAVPSTIGLKSGSVTTVAEVPAGLTETQALEKLSPAVAIASSGRPVTVNAAVVQNGAAFNGTKTIAGATLTYTITYSSVSASDLVATTTKPVTAETVSEGIPDVGPYTLAQVERLRTDGTTRGVPAGTTLKRVGVDALPSGITVSGSRITVAASANVPSVSGWDFQGYDWIVQGRVQSFTNCIFGYRTDLALCLFDLHPASRIDKFSRCSFLGAGYYGSMTTKECFRARLASLPTVDGPEVDLIERCDFFGWGGDVMKSSWGGAIRLCYFDTPINLPSGTEPWSSSRNYSVGQWATTADGKYAYSAKVAGSNKALPYDATLTDPFKATNSNWQNQDPHSDTLNPVYQLNEMLLIEACYINRLESTRAVDPGIHRAIGINNGIRAMRDTNDRRYGLVEMANVIVSKSEVNASFPISLGNLSFGESTPSILRDSWIGKQSGGGTVHPGNANGHTITNVLDYANPTGASASFGEVGTPGTGGGGGGTPDPDPAPPPVIDTTTPAIVMGIGQSEMDWLTITHPSWNIGTRPDLKAQNFKMYDYQGGYRDTEPMTVTDLTQANRAAVSHTMIRLANTLHYIVPGKKFVFGAAHESGSSLMSLVNDGDWPGLDSNGKSKDRVWANTAQIANAIMADYPGQSGTIVSYWWAADTAYMPTWLPTFAPAIFKQYEDGTPFTFGTVHSRMRSLTVDRAYFDFNSSGPTVKGQGLFPRTWKYDLVMQGRRASDTAAKYRGVQAFADDARFKALGGVYGQPANIYKNGNRGHADEYSPYGQTLSAYEFLIPSMLRAAGIPIKTPEFVNVFTAADGSYAEVELSCPNGGYLSTDEKVRGGQPLKQNMTGPLSQEVFGFEIERASGGGKYWIVRSGATGYESKYKGTVTLGANNKVRIVMNDPLVNGDKITFNWGHGTHREDANFPIGYPINGNANMVGYPLEHVPAYFDKSSDFGFAGFNPMAFSKEFSVVRGSKVGVSAAAPVVTPPPATPDPVDPADPPPPTGETPTVWATSTSGGPVFESAAAMPTGTDRVDLYTQFRIGASVSSFGAIARQAFGGFHWRLVANSGGTWVEINSVISGSDYAPDTRNFSTLPRGTWIALHLTVDLKTGVVTYRRTGQANETKNLKAGYPSVFPSGRKVALYGQSTSASDRLPAGIDYAYTRVEATIGAGAPVDVIDIRGSAETINASPRKVTGNAV